MSTNLESVMLWVSLGWFVVYWILGGVVFAILTATRSIHVRKARFSCLFTIISAASAYGATVMGLLLAQRPCARDQGAVEAVLKTLSCASKELLIAGGMWFVLLLCVGCLALILSRAEKR